MDLGSAALGLDCSVSSGREEDSSTSEESSASVDCPSGRGRPNRLRHALYNKVVVTRKLHTIKETAISNWEIMGGIRAALGFDMSPGSNETMQQAINRRSIRMLPENATRITRFEREGRLTRHRMTKGVAVSTMSERIWSIIDTTPPTKTFFWPFSAVLSGDLPPWHTTPLTGHVQHSYCDDEIEYEYYGECRRNASSAVAIGEYTRDGKGEADTC